MHHGKDLRRRKKEGHPGGWPSLLRGERLAVLRYLAFSLLGRGGAYEDTSSIWGFQVLHVPAVEALLVDTVYVTIEVHVTAAPRASLEKYHHLRPSRPSVSVAAVLINRIAKLDAFRVNKVFSNHPVRALLCNRC